LTNLLSEIIDFENALSKSTYFQFRASGTEKLEVVPECQKMEQ